MKFTRTLKHLFYPGWWLRKHFPLRELKKLESAIDSSESKHSGEIRLAIESSLPFNALWRDESVRERSEEVFSLLRVWDTEDNNGVLIYLLLADKKVEITVDRNIAKVVSHQEWQRICGVMEQAFQQKQFIDGLSLGIDEITKHLQQYFPDVEGSVNELSNKPVIL